MREQRVIPALAAATLAAFGIIYLAPWVSADREATARTILLADDQPEVLRLTSRLLRGAGYRVLEARDGAEGLELVRAHRGQIDLLLTDVVMPGISGFELAERVRSLRPETEVLYVSGFIKDLASSGRSQGARQLPAKAVHHGRAAVEGPGHPAQLRD